MAGPSQNKKKTKKKSKVKKEKTRKASASSWAEAEGKINEAKSKILDPVFTDDELRQIELLKKEGVLRSPSSSESKQNSKKQNEAKDQTVHDLNEIIEKHADLCLSVLKCAKDMETLISKFRIFRDLINAREMRPHMVGQRLNFSSLEQDYMVAAFKLTKAATKSERLNKIFKESVQDYVNSNDSVFE